MTKDPTTGHGEPMPPEVEGLVLREIEPGEAIAWIGRPAGRLTPHPMLVAFGVMGLFIVAFMILWMAASIGAPNGAVAALVGLPFLALGLAIAATPYRVRRMGEQTAYVVTDRRAILFLPGVLTGRKVVSLGPEQVARLAVVERGDGSGDLAFVPLADASLLWLASLEILYDRGFERIAQVREVESLIRRTLLEKGDAPA